MKRLLALLLLILSVLPAAATDLSVSLHLTVNDGLPRNGVFAVMQSREGTVYIGTWDGLFTYDGAEIREVMFSPSSRTPVRTVNALAEDADGRIWMATSEGVAVFDPATRRCHESSIASGHISSIVCDAAGNIHCIENRERCVSYSRASGAVTRRQAEVVFLMPGGRAGYIWRGQVTGTATFKGLPHVTAHTAFADARGTLYVALADGRVFRAGADRTFRPLKQQFSKPVRAMAEYGTSILLSTSDGLYSLPAGADKAERVGGLNDANVTTLFVDREKGLWVGTFFGGVNYVSPAGGNFGAFAGVNERIDGHVVSGIACDGAGNFWFGVEDGGLSFYNTADGSVTNYNSRSAGNGFRPSADNVQTVFIDGPTLYVGTSGGGMDVVALPSLRRRRLEGEKLPPSVYAFEKTADGRIWIGTMAGLFVLDRISGRISAFDKVPRAIVHSLTRGADGALWVASQGAGLFRIGAGGDCRHYSLPTNMVMSACPYGTKVYAGTEGDGLFVVDQRSGAVSRLPVQLPERLMVFKIIAAASRIWFSTNRGLMAYRPDTRSLEHYTVRDGLCSNQFKINAGLLTRDGMMVLGSVNGVNAFYPALLRPDNTRPSAMITDFYLFNRRCRPGAPGSPLDSAVSVTRRIVLERDNHSIGFRFASSSHSDPSKNRYEYMLEPLETEWRSITEPERMASYTNLAPGTYTLRLRTANGSGLLSDERRLEVVIKPYWWLTGPMKALYLLLAAAGIALLAARARARQRRKIRLITTEKEAEVYRAKMEFFTFMVHEIRTPLTLVLGPLQSIMKRPAQSVAEVREDLEVMERNAGKLLGLVNNLLDFRRMEETSYGVAAEPVAVGPVVRRIAEDFRTAGGAGGCLIEDDTAGADCYAMADTAAVEKIAVNLLGNAVKYARSRVTASVRTDGRTVTLCVEDDGPGIPAGERERVFEPFRRLEDGQTGAMPAAGGSGIGLAVVRRLAEIMGGSVAAGASAAGGARLVVMLPAACPPEPAADDAAEEPAEEGRSLLVVDDNADIRRYVARVLGGGRRVDTASSASEALRACAAHSYDLIVTDFMMPDTDGGELCRRLKADIATSHIPVILLTAKADAASQELCFRCGADLYVAKPFTPEVLLSQVEAVLANRERVKRRFASEPETGAEVLCAASSADEEFLQRLGQLIEEHMAEATLSVDFLAAGMAMGRSSFYAKVKGLTGQTPNDYLRTARLKHAVRLMKRGERRINEICYAVGFSSPSYFARRFTAMFGQSPSDFMRGL